MKVLRKDFFNFQENINGKKTAPIRSAESEKYYDIKMRCPRKFNPVCNKCMIPPVIGIYNKLMIPKFINLYKNLIIP